MDYRKCDFCGQWAYIAGEVRNLIFCKFCYVQNREKIARFARERP